MRKNKKGKGQWEKKSKFPFLRAAARPLLDASLILNTEYHRQEVNINITRKELSLRYRILARTLHPDKWNVPNFFKKRTYTPSEIFGGAKPTKILDTPSEIEGSYPMVSKNSIDFWILS